MARTFGRIGLSLATIAAAMAAIGSASVEASDSFFVTRQADAARTGKAPDGPLPPLTRRWKADLGGFASTPVIADGRVFAIGGITNGTAAVLWAFDASTGRSLWGPIDIGGMAEEGTSYPMGEITYSDGLVITSTDRLRAFDAETGALVWQRAYQAHALLVYDGLLLVRTNREERALNPATGRIEWRNEPYWPSPGGLSAHAGRLYAAQDCGSIEVFDATDGERVFSTHHDCGGAAIAPPTIAGGRLFIANWGNIPDHIVDADTGEVVDTYKTDSMPIVEQDVVFVRNGNALQAFDFTETNGNGKPEWSFGGDGQLTGDPLMIGNNIFITSQSGELYAVNKATGHQGWSGALGAQPAPVGLAAAEGKLVVATAQGLSTFVTTGAAPGPELQAQPRPQIDLWQGRTSKDAVAYQISRGHNALQLSAAPKLPLQEEWRRELGAFVSYPLIVGDRVFVTVADGSEEANHAYALDRRDGETIWGPVPLHDGGFSSSTLTYAGGRLFTTNHRGITRALDSTTGKTLWKRDLQQHSYDAWSFSSPPAVSNGRVVVLGYGLGETVFALNASDGKVRWVRDASHGVFTAPIAVGNRAYLSQTCSESAHDLETGRRIWSRGRGCSAARGFTPVLAHGTLHLRSGVRNFAARASDGKILNTFSGLTPPVIHGNVVMTIVGPYLQARHLPTNTILWRFRGASELEIGPVVGGKTAYVAATEGTLYGVDVRTGEQVWSGEAGAQIMPERHHGYTLNGMTIGRGTLLVPAGGSLVAFR